MAVSLLQDWHVTLTSKDIRWHKHNINIFFFVFLIARQSEPSGTWCRTALGSDQGHQMVTLDLVSGWGCVTEVWLISTSPTHESCTWLTDTSAPVHNNYKPKQNQTAFILIYSAVKQLHSDAINELNWNRRIMWTSEHCKPSLHVPGGFAYIYCYNSLRSPVKDY